MNRPPPLPARAQVERFRAGRLKVGLAALRLTLLGHGQAGVIPVA